MYNHNCFVCSFKSSTNTFKLGQLVLSRLLQEPCGSNMAQLACAANRCCISFTLMPLIGKPLLFDSYGVRHLKLSVRNCVGKMLALARCDKTATRVLLHALRAGNRRVLLSDPGLFRPWAEVSDEAKDMLHRYWTTLHHMFAHYCRN